MKPMASPQPRTLATYKYHTSTNNNGHFSIPHGLGVHYTGGGSWEIEGITVAVQHQNNNWHTLELSNTVDNRFWWNDTVVAGTIFSPHFHNRPVKIIVFAEWNPA